MKTKLRKFGILIAASLLSPLLWGQNPASSFSLSQSNICVGANLQITDLSTQAPDTWIYTTDTQTLTSQNPTISFSTAGIHSITLVASNSNGAGAAFTETVLVNALPSLVVSASTSTVCSGDALNMTCSGATTYTWINGITNGVNFTPVASAEYTVSGEDANGCIDIATYSVTVHTLPVLSISGNPAVCLGSALSLTVSGADSYAWSNSSTSDVLIDSPTSSDNYTVIGTDATTGCSNTSVLPFTVNPLPTVLVNGGTICSGNSFTISPTGANTYTYSSGNAIVAPTAETDYSVSGTDANGCVSAEVTLTVSVNALPVVGVNGGLICSGEIFTLSPYGALNYTYSSGSNTVAPATSTSYTVIGTDWNGCVSAVAAVSDVTVNPLPVVSVNSGAICAGDNFTIIASGAITYTYSGGNTLVSPVTTTSYNVTGTDALGCISAVAVSTVTVNQLPVISVNSGSICTGASFVMTASGASTYTYSSGSNIVSPTTNTSYSVSGTSAAGCLSAADAVSNVSVNVLPVISVNSGSICAGKSFTITASGANTYTYSGGNTIVSPATTTLYSVSGTDANGCVSAASAISNVTVNALPLVSVNSGAICAGDNFTITASGANTYTYTGGNNIVSPVTTTLYSVSGTDAFGCVSAAAISNVTVNALPVISVNSGAICAGDNFTITPSGANTYTYSSLTNIVSPATTTLYAVIGTDANGCMSAMPAISDVTVNALPVISVNSGAICTGGSFTISASGATTYTYSSGNNIVTPATTTLYAVMGTDALGCMSAIPAISNVTVNALPTVAISANTLAVCAGQNATLTASGANTYSWNTTSTANAITVTPLVTTTYSVTGTDLNGCKNSVLKVVTVYNLPTVAASGSSVICVGENVTIVASGAVTYSWNTSATNATLVETPQTTTSYTVTGTDVNGCANTSAFTASVSECAGLSNTTAQALEVKIYPNPSNGNFSIELQNAAQATVISADGRVVYQQDLSAGSNAIQLETLPNGVYFIQVSNGTQMNNIKWIKTGM